MASYEDLKRLSSFFDSDNEDSFPAAPSSGATITNSMGDSKNGGLTEDDIDPEFKERKVEEMVKLTLMSKDICLFYLESMNWNVAAAVKSYYDYLR